MTLVVVEFAAHNEVQFEKKGVKIGSLFTGAAGFADTKTGVFWHVIPPMSDDERRVQKALAPGLNQAFHKRKGEH